jgi:hypothetical protein
MRRNTRSNAGTHVARSFGAPRYEARADSNADGDEQESNNPRPLRSIRSLSDSSLLPPGASIVNLIMKQMAKRHQPIPNSYQIWEWHWGGWMERNEERRLNNIGGKVYWRYWSLETGADKAPTAILDVRPR